MDSLDNLEFNDDPKTLYTLYKKGISVSKNILDTEEKEYLIRASIDNVIDQPDSFKTADPFNKSWTELKSYNGLDNNFKRRTSRLV